MYDIFIALAVDFFNKTIQGIHFNGLMGRIIIAIGYRFLSLSEEFFFCHSLEHSLITVNVVFFRLPRLKFDFSWCFMPGEKRISRETQQNISFLFM